MDLENLRKYVNGLSYIQPEIVYILKYKFRETTEGGIYLPAKITDLASKSSEWARIVLLSPLVSNDSTVEDAKKRFTPDMWVQVPRGCPISGALNNTPLFCFIHILDIRAACSEEWFKKYVEPEFYRTFEPSLEDQLETASVA